MKNAIITVVKFHNTGKLQHNFEKLQLTQLYSQLSNNKPIKNLSTQRTLFTHSIPHCRNPSIQLQKIIHTNGKALRKLTL